MNEYGATSSEYAIVMGLIAVVIIGVVAALGQTTGELFCVPVESLGNPGCEE